MLPFSRRLPSITPRRAALALLLLAASGVVTACAGLGFLAGAASGGDTIPAEYTDWKDKSLAIVVYPDMATALEYARVRDEISSFVANQFHDHLATVKLVDYKDVIRWQDDTPDWQAVPQKDIGHHFAVDRVLYIELLEYTTREPGSSNLLRGHIHANVAVFDTSAPGPDPAWQSEIDSHWPATLPQESLQQDDTTVRKHILQTFSNDLVDKFYDHKDNPEPLHEQN